MSLAFSQTDDSTLVYPTFFNSYHEVIRVQPTSVLNTTLRYFSQTSKYRHSTYNPENKYPFRRNTKHQLYRFCVFPGIILLSGEDSYSTVSILYIDCMRKKLVWIAGLFIVVGSCASFVFFKSDSYYKEVYSSWQELDERTQPTIPSLPIATASDALQYVVRNTKLLSSLKDIEEKGEHDSWSVTSKRIEPNEEMMWSVRIKSQRFIPSYTCVQTFRSSGEATSDGWPDNYCSYDKYNK